MSRSSLSALLLAVAGLASACTCSEPATLQGRVVDLWEKPVPAATVTMPGAEGPAKSDDKGHYAFPIKAGRFKVTAEKEGFITRSQDVDVTDASKDTIANVRIIPEPATEGYHVVGPESYLPLAPESVLRLGNELQAFQGVKSSGSVEVDGKAFRVVYHTNLKMEKVAQLDIELHRLTFTHEMEVATVDGAQKVDVNLWVDAGKVEFQREELDAHNYVFRADNLPSGTYAFVSVDLLDPKNAQFEQLPEGVRRVHPFAIK
jgi:hypothetical protein